MNSVDTSAKDEASVRIAPKFPTIHHEELSEAGLRLFAYRKDNSRGPKVWVLLHIILVKGTMLIEQQQSKNCAWRTTQRTSR